MLETKLISNSALRRLLRDLSLSQYTNYSAFREDGASYITNINQGISPILPVSIHCRNSLPIPIFSTFRTPFSLLPLPHPLTIPLKPPRILSRPTRLFHIPARDLAIWFLTHGELFVRLWLGFPGLELILLRRGCRTASGVRGVLETRRGRGGGVGSMGIRRVIGGDI